MRPAQVETRSRLRPATSPNVRSCPRSLLVTLPPLTVLWLVPELEEEPEPELEVGEAEEPPPEEQ
jgi:hypothetical protein